MGIIKTYEEFVNEGFKDLFKKVRNDMVQDSKDFEIKIGDKTINAEKLTIAINKNLKSEDKKDVSKFVENIVEIVSKDKDNFKDNIAPVLKEWVDKYNKDGVCPMDVVIKDEDCTKYIKDIIDELVSKYKWESLTDWEVVTYDDTDEEDEMEVYNTGFIAYVLASIADEI